MHKAVHLNNVKDRLYVSRKEGVRGLANIQDIMNASIRELKDEIKKSKERLNTVSNNITDDMRSNRITKTWKQMEKNQLHGYLNRQTCEIHIYQPPRSGRI